MEDQQPFPPVEDLPAAPEQTSCLWCGAAAVKHVEVEPALKSNGTVKRAAIRQPACRGCAARLETRKAEALEEKKRNRKGPLG